MGPERFLYPRVALLLRQLRSDHEEADTKDKERCIPLHTIHSSLGPSLCKCLPSLHALTWCDSMSAFAGIGGQSPERC